MHEGEDKKRRGEGGKALMDVKVLRKKNSELMALIKQLDDKQKTLKAEHDQLVSLLYIRALLS